MLKTRHISTNIIPTTSSTSKIITMKIFIVFVSLIGVPSGGIPTKVQAHDNLFRNTIPGQTTVVFLAVNFRFSFSDSQ